MDNQIRVEKIPAGQFKTFRVRCFYAGVTMREAVIWFIKQVVTGKIALPKKEDK